MNSQERIRDEKEEVAQSNMSMLEKTLQEIENRVNFLKTHNISAENSLLPSSNAPLTVRSISEILTPLKYYHMAETPLNLNLMSIYQNQDNKNTLKWHLLAPSSGEDSINEEEVFQPSFKWLTSALVDPSLLQVDRIEPRKIEKDRVGPQWKGVKEIMLLNVKTKIYLKSQIKSIQFSIKKRFQRFSWVKFKRVKEVYYRGRPTLILKFSDEVSAGFVYYNLSSPQSREEFGPDTELLRVVKNDLRETGKLKNWILLFFRRIPLTMTKQHILSVIGHQVHPQWFEQLVEIEGWKYGVCKVRYLDEALTLCGTFNARKIKDAKVNIHPKSSKNWQADEKNQELLPQNV